MSDDPVAKAQTMIRAPIAKVFQAFVDPAVTTKLWFSKSSGPLVEGAVVRWDWEMYGVADDIHVRKVEPNRALVFDWGGSEEGSLTHVEWTFTELAPDQTFVEVTNSGFFGEAAVAQALDSNGGFTTVLCAAKAWLELGVNLRLIEDKFPQALQPDWKGRE